MLLPSKQGIKCDSCGGVCQGDFIYYSLDFKLVEIINSRAKSPIQLISVLYSAEICPRCMASIEELIRKNYRAIKARDSLCCDICGALMRQNFTYYHCNVTYVSVSMTNGQFICRKCNAPVSVKNEQCSKCQAVATTCIAHISSDDKYVQLAVCSDDYEKFVNRAVKMRNIVGEVAQKEIKHG